MLVVAELIRAQFSVDGGQQRIIRLQRGGRNSRRGLHVGRGLLLLTGRPWSTRSEMPIPTPSASATARPAAVHACGRWSHGNAVLPIAGLQRLCGCGATLCPQAAVLRKAADGAGDSLRLLREH